MTKVISELKNISESIRKKGHSSLAAEIDFVILKHSGKKSILSKLHALGKEVEFEIPKSEYQEIMQAFASLEDSLIKVASEKNKKNNK